MTRLYVAVDFFCPSVYTRNPVDAGQEVYGADNGAYYAILQPMLLQWNFASSRDSLDLKAYLDGPGPVELEPIAGATADWIRANPPDKAAIPVPFPPATRLAGNYQWSGGAAQALSDRIVDDPTGAFALSPTEWGTFAKNNFVPLKVTSYGSLTDAQRQRFAEWAYGFFLAAQAETLRATELGTSPNLNPSERALWNELRQVPGSSDMTAWTRSFRGNDQSPARAWRTFDLVYAGGPPPAGNLASAPKISAPKFTCDAAQIVACATALFPQSAYHTVLWNEIRRLAGVDEKKAADSLKRLFGFGERLRWKERPGDDAFMVLRARDEFSPDNDKWFVTNVHSLLGQVRRIEAPPAGSSFDALNVSINNHPLVFQDPAMAPPEFVVGLRTLHTSAIASNTQFKGELTRDPAASQGRFTYYPRCAVASSTAITWNDGQARKLTLVPPSLLDALDPYARHEARSASWGGWSVAAPLPPPCDTISVAEIARLHPPRLLVKTSELFAAGAYPDLSDVVTHLRMVRLSAAIRQIEVAGLQGGESVYELRIEDRIHADDSAAVRKCLESLTTDSQAVLLVPDAGGFKRVPLSGGRLIAVDAAARTFSISGRLTNADDLTTLLNKELRRLDVLCSAAQLPTGEQAFNAFGTLAAAADATGPALILSNDFELTYSLSTEGIFERFRLNLQPAISATAFDDPTTADPVEMHFANFNKLRLAALKPGTAWTDYRALVGSERDDAFLLTYPEALVPLNPNAGNSPVDRGGPSPHGTYWYKVGHSFTENIPSGGTVDESEVRAEMLASEGVHYQLYRKPGEQWDLRGTVEHQYGHRVPVRTSSPIQLRYSTDVQNPAGLVLQAKPIAAANGHEKRLAAILFFTAGRELRVELNREYFADLSSNAAIITGPSSMMKPGELRALYESLMDFQNGTSTMIAERWNFSNVPRPEDSGASNADDVSFPNVARYLRHVETLSCDVAALESRLALLLKPTFEEFATNLAAVTSDAANVLWTSLAVVTRAAAFDEDTDVVRAALSIVRKDAQTIAGSLVPPPPANALATVEPLLPDPQATASKLLRDFSALASNAQREIASYLRSDTSVPPYMETPLRESLIWLTASTPTRGTNLPSTRDGIADPPRERREKMFGSLYRNLDFPRGLRTAIPGTMKLFYVPHSFAPLRAHPALGDPETTTEFARYLMSVLDDIARKGKSSLVRESDDQKALLLARARAVDLLERADGIGARLARTVHRVEVEDPRYANVTSMVRELDAFPAPFIGERLQSRLAAMLAASPSIFATAKGIGVAVTDHATFQDELYTLQLTKRVANAVTSPEPIAPVIDRDRFTFRQLSGVCEKRYLLDVLDDVTYDDEFAIDTNRTNGQNIVSRGGAMARTVDDVIEQKNEFDGAEAITTRRTLEVDVVHYNPSWVESSTGDKYYLLPSRRFPAIPVAILPAMQGAATTAASGKQPDTPWFTSVSAFDGSSGPVDVTTPRFGQLLRAAIPERVNLPLGGSWASARRVPNSLKTVGDVASVRVDGWYHVESYLSMYYFVVAPAEDGFSNDTFKLETETWPSHPPVPEPKHRPTMSAVSPLLQWFSWSKTEHQNAETRPPRPVPVPVEAAVDEIEAWCVSPDKNPSWTRGQELLASRRMDEVVPQPRPAGVGFHTASFTKQTVDWKFTPETNAGVGSVVAADILELRGTNDQPIQDADGRAMLVLRFAVLDDPWCHTRARVRVRRNVRDLNNDGKSDFSPIFEMIEESEWVGYGRHFVRLDPSELPSGVDRLRADVTGVTSRDAWLNAAGEVTFGPLVNEILGREFTTSSANRRFWSTKASGDDVIVRGEVLQRIEDRHARVGSIPSRVSIGSPLPSVRDEEKTYLLKQYVPEARGSALDTAPTRLDKTVVRTADPYLRITWFTSDGHVPVMQATWPIAWN